MSSCYLDHGYEIEDNVTAILCLMVKVFVAQTIWTGNMSGHVT